MANIICVRPIWDREALPMPRKLQYRRGDRLHPVKFFPVHVGPEPDHPVGRKGHVLARAWEQLRGSPPADGLLILDGDVAVDPEHTRAMIEAIDSDCTRVWTAPVRIWPVSTHRQDWVWAHWEDHASQELDMFPRYFSFSFTYLPAGLVDKANMETNVSALVSEH